ncbi:hypothetical protein POL68_16615 [Stigmatella sp. ncwal1]|uniref:Uncharacterized protein n=1 Tax=Stigmatella ashevillensis TaxID=2995309 RepID=A0ABT5DCM6_9BACT|nr:hypothetical protein [Stigmatella ashevillena]MDC0710101.1 hypothetical protein [Stigmatella ashevillena]
MARFLVFCESPTDFETITTLAERVIREKGPEWLREMLEEPIEGAEKPLEWGRDDEGRSFFDIHKVSDYARRLGIRAPRGHFNGEPGAAGALMARTIFRIVRELVNRGEGVGAVLLVWDMDHQGDERRAGLKQARDVARRFESFGIVLGCPDPMKEAWVLAGFEPVNEAERRRLAQLRQELSFDPCQEAHRLGDKQEQAKRSPKRVLHVLTDGDPERASHCWSTTPLDRLVSRGKDSGLAEFLAEAEVTLIPILTGAPVGAPAARR